MKILKSGVSLFAAVLALGACSASTDSGRLGASDEALNAGDVKACRAKADGAAAKYTAEWTKALTECLLEEAKAQAGDGGPSGNQACSVAVSSVNGVSRCSGGPNDGKPCSGAECQRLCSYDADGRPCGSGGAPPATRDAGRTPPVARDAGAGGASGGQTDSGRDGPDGHADASVFPSSNDGGSTSCSYAVSVVDGATTCSGGPNAGRACTSAAQCKALCSYDAAGNVGCAP